MTISRSLCLMNPVFVDLWRFSRGTEAGRATDKARTCAAADPGLLGVHSILSGLRYRVGLAGQNSEAGRDVVVVDIFPDLDGVGG